MRIADITQYRVPEPPPEGFDQRGDAEPAENRGQIDENHQEGGVRGARVEDNDEQGCAPQAERRTAGLRQSG
jgi:hypothetical protein